MLPSLGWVGCVAPRHRYNKLSERSPWFWLAVGVAAVVVITNMIKAVSMGGVGGPHLEKKMVLGFLSKRHQKQINPIQKSGSKGASCSMWFDLKALESAAYL